MANDSIGDRMKSQYEERTRIFLPRRTYTILRVDGKAFHTYCRGMERPYDKRFIAAMDMVAREMLSEIMGAELAYVQSDEISFLLTDFAKPNTEAWFDGNIQKMSSVAAGLATGYFNALMLDETERLVGGVSHKTLGTFDARVFTIPDHVEVENYFIWRQQDAERNSIQMLAQHYYSHKQLHEKNCSVLQDMIHEKGDNWNDHPARFKRGGLVYYDSTAQPYPAWKIADECPVFTSEEGRPFLKSLIPIHWREDAVLDQTTR
jgi:tRNA(His) 5'-end guanylyltransferase